MRLIGITSLAICGFALLTGCTKLKNNNQEQEKIAMDQFLTPPSNATPQITRIINAIKNQEEHFHFLYRTIRTEGYALWGNAKIFQKKGKNTAGSTFSVVLVPLSLPGTQMVSSFITCQLDDTVKIRLMRGGDYAQYGFINNFDSLSAQKIAATCMLLEKTAFGHSEYQVNDKRLFNYIPGGQIPSKTTVKLVTSNSSAGKSATLGRGWVTIFYSYEIEVENELSQVNCPPGEACNWTHTETVFDHYAFWVPDIPGGSSTFGADYNPWTANGFDPCGGTQCTPVIEGWQYSNNNVAPNVIVYDTSFVNSLLKCQLDLLKQNNAFFSQLFNSFDGVIGNSLTFRISNSPYALPGVTRGSGNFRYQITFSKDIDTSSNLIRILTLTHELIHAKIFHALETAGILTFNADGNPVLDSTAGLSTTQVNLLNVSETERFRLMIKRYQDTYVANGLPEEQWTHDLFNTAYFDVQTYRQKIQTLIFDMGDWQHQPTAYTNFLKNSFGTTGWEYSAAECISWEGLQLTAGFNQYLNSFTPVLSHGFHDSTIIVTKYQSKNNCP